MDKIIYKITNNINGKVYIGQTNNLKRRLNEHKNSSKPSEIHRAIKKYGWDNFSVDVLYTGDQYNEKEKQFINEFHSNDKRYGYNIKNGGEDSSGENNPMSKLTEDQVDCIKSRILNGEEFSSIVNSFNGSLTMKNLLNINSGWCWKDSQHVYPLRKIDKRLDLTTEKTIVEMLLSGESIDEIENVTGVKRYTILQINSGKAYKDSSLIYPLQSLHFDATPVIEDLQKNELTFNQISLKYKKSLSQIYKINNGKCYYMKNINYPIRKIVVMRNEHGKYICGSQ